MLSVLDEDDDVLSAEAEDVLEDEISSLEALSALLTDMLITDELSRGSSVFVLQPQSRIAAKTRAATHFFILSP